MYDVNDKFLETVTLDGSITDPFVGATNEGGIAYATFSGSHGSEPRRTGLR